MRQSRSAASRFLPRAHSEEYGWLDKSNWKDVSIDRNLRRVDPMLREIVRTLNKKGYKTYSSCSGGHASNQRRRHQRHVEGYIAFSPPTRAVVELYFMLRGKHRQFQLSTQVGMLDEDNGSDQTAYSELRWQLHDMEKHQNMHYKELLKDLLIAADNLPVSGRDGGQDERFLRSFFGEKHAKDGFQLVKNQRERFH